MHTRRIPLDCVHVVGLGQTVSGLRRAPIRAEEEGGTWDGEEADRISILEAIGTGPHPPRYIDLELGSWQARVWNMKAFISALRMIAPVSTLRSTTLAEVQKFR